MDDVGDLQERVTSDEVKREIKYLNVRELIYRRTKKCSDT